jgi:60 kDa SS-A/Ro ribonucleoprotein
MENMTVYNNFATSLNATAQTSKIPGRSDMVQNNAGGFVFSVSPMDLLDRFLILGTESNTYYASSNTMTKDAATSIIKLIETNGVDVVNRVVEISHAGRAPKNDPALFVLALAMTFGDSATKALANASVNKVARTGTHILHLAEFVNSMRGWGRGIRTAFGNWYLNRSPLSLAQQVTKYANRDGWTHRDVLRLAHVKPTGDEQSDIFATVTGKERSANSNSTASGAYLDAVNSVKTETNVAKAIKLIKEFNLPREVIPTQMLNDVKVWEALLPDMGITALIRNLGKMSSLGMFTPLSENEKFVVNVITDKDVLKNGRVHPLNLLIAQKVYSMGNGFKGSNTWSVSRSIVSALEVAFYKAFEFVEPTNKNHLIALDCSGSMHWGNVSNNVPITPAMASAVMAMVSLKRERNTFIAGFGSTLRPLDIRPEMTLEQVVHVANMSNFGTTDCSAPMTYAIKNNLPVDCFSVYTDNETYVGNIHPSQALKQYRSSTGRNAKLAVVGMTATNFTIADPKDAGMMDFIGFDSAAPALMANFFRS